MPSIGMPLSHLLTMVWDQPNKDLVEHLLDQSQFLPNLEIQFAGISYIERMRLYWAYKTKTSPTVVVSNMEYSKCLSAGYLLFPLSRPGVDFLQAENGSYAYPGPRSVMVDRQSATGDRLSDLVSTIQIDEDHSNLVKFSLSDYKIPIVISKISDIGRSQEQVAKALQRRLRYQPAVVAAASTEEAQLVSDAGVRQAGCASPFLE